MKDHRYTKTLRYILGRAKKKCVAGCSYRASSTVWYLLAGEAEFEFTRSPIDDGGVVRSTGGEFELSGTIGPPDAGVMTGGEFELTGGLWFGIAPTDGNNDGLVSLLDHETFTACMLGPDAGIDANPCPCFAVDRDGDVTLNDYAKLQAGFTEQ